MPSMILVDDATDLPLWDGEVDRPPPEGASVFVHEISEQPRDEAPTTAWKVVGVAYYYTVAAGERSSSDFIGVRLAKIEP